MNDPIDMSGSGEQECPFDIFDDVTVYLLCGNKRYTLPNGRKVWIHYIGATNNLRKRLYLHRRGQGAKLCKAMVDQGIKLKLARTWSNFDTTEAGWRKEKELKKQRSAAQLCPHCKARRAKYVNKKKRDIRAVETARRKAEKHQLETERLQKIGQGVLFKPRAKK